MPIIARCKECGYILYDGEFIGMQFPAYNSIPHKIMIMHKGKCPNCRRKLEMPSARRGDVIILPNPEVNFPFFKKRKEVKDE